MILEHRCITAIEGFDAKKSLNTILTSPLKLNAFLRKKGPNAGKSCSQCVRDRETLVYVVNSHIQVSKLL